MISSHILLKLSEIPNLNNPIRKSDDVANLENQISQVQQRILNSKEFKNSTLEFSDTVFLASTLSKNHPAWFQIISNKIFLASLAKLPWNSDLIYNVFSNLVAKLKETSTLPQTDFLANFLLVLPDIKIADSVAFSKCLSILKDNTAVLHSHDSQFLLKVFHSLFNQDKHLDVLNIDQLVSVLELLSLEYSPLINVQTGGKINAEKIVLEEIVKSFLKKMVKKVDSQKMQSIISELNVNVDTKNFILDYLEKQFPTVYPNFKKRVLDSDQPQEISEYLRQVEEKIDKNLFEYKDLQEIVARVDRNNIEQMINTLRLVSKMPITFKQMMLGRNFFEHALKYDQVLTLKTIQSTISSPNDYFSSIESVVELLSRNRQYYHVAVTFLKDILVEPLSEEKMTHFRFVRDISCFLDFCKYCEEVGLQIFEMSHKDFISKICIANFSSTHTNGQQQLKFYLFNNCDILDAEDCKKIILTKNEFPEELDFKLQFKLIKKIIDSEGVNAETQEIAKQVLHAACSSECVDLLVSYFYSVGWKVDFVEVGEWINNIDFNPPETKSRFLNKLRTTTSGGLFKYLNWQIDRIDRLQIFADKIIYRDLISENKNLSLKQRIQQEFPSGSNISPLKPKFEKLVYNLSKTEQFFLANIIEKYGFWSSQVQDLLLGKSTRAELEKTGSRIWVFKNGLIKNQIATEKFEAWEKLAKVVPVSPIIRGYKNGHICDVFTIYCGKTARDALDEIYLSILSDSRFIKEKMKFREEIWRQILDIKSKIIDSPFTHGHLHMLNFTVQYCPSNQLNLSDSDSLNNYQEKIEFLDLSDALEAMSNGHTSQSAKERVTFVACVRVIDLDELTIHG